MNKEYIVIFGGNGFIGQHLVNHLASYYRDFTIVVIDKEVRNYAEKDSIEVLQDSHTNLDSNAVETHMSKATVVIDFAYASVPKTSFSDPVNDINANLPRAVKLLELVSRYTNIRKLIVMSSGGTVYGNVGHLPITENHLTNPISPYGITKLSIEKYALMYHALKKIPVVILRPSNIYGPGQLPFRGQGFIATAIGNLLKNKPITIFGGGGTVRDYLYIDDLVKAIDLAIQYGQAGEAYNIGSGIGLSNLDIIEYLRPLLEQDNHFIEIRNEEPRFFDVDKNVLSLAKFQHQTGWKPSMNIIDGLQKVYEWIKLHYEGK